MFSLCFLPVFLVFLLVFSLCFPGVFLLLSWCFLGVFLVFSFCFLGVFLGHLGPWPRALGPVKNVDVEKMLIMCCVLRNDFKHRNHV